MTHSQQRRIPSVRALSILALAAVLAACQSSGFPFFGSGASRAADGTIDRTFSTPFAPLKAATLSAMSRVKIRHTGTEKTREGEMLKGVAPGHTVEILLEPLDPITTRMRIAARTGNNAYDSTFATELLAQTERLAGAATRRSAP